MTMLNVRIRNRLQQLYYNSVLNEGLQQIYLHVCIVYRFVSARVHVLPDFSFKSPEALTAKVGGGAKRGNMTKATLAWIPDDEHAR